MIIDPVFDSPTKATALMSGCSVSALPAPSPMPFTRFSTPGGKPASCAISASRRADSGLNSAGLWTTVQPAAKAGAIFHVDSMKGVFQGVMTPTGPMGLREVTFRWVAVGRLWPSRAAGARSAKKRKFSAPRSAAFDMNRHACPVSQHSQRAISSARSSIRSAMRCRMALRLSPGNAAQDGNAAFAALAAASMSAAVPSATSAIRLSSTGLCVGKVPPDPARLVPPIRFRMPPARNRARCPSSRARWVARSVMGLPSAGSGGWNWPWATARG